MSARVAAIEAEIDRLSQERRAFTPERLDIIHKAIYVYGPLLKDMRQPETTNPA